MRKDSGRNSKILPVEVTVIFEASICFAEPKCAMADEDMAGDPDSGGRVDGGAALEGAEIVGGSMTGGTKTDSPSGERNSPSRRVSPRKMSVYQFIYSSIPTFFPFLFGWLQDNS
jgi:hypothetical protein